jgi:hypothetical protein
MEGFSALGKKRWIEGLTHRVWGYTLVNALERRNSDLNAPNLDKSIV